MEPQINTILANHADKSLLSIFLHELNVARRKLSLYPPEHPHIAASVENTLVIIKELFKSTPTITIGISPDALYFEQLWLDKDDVTNQEFANHFSTLGIASISFKSGLNGAELIRFNQLLRSDAATIDSFGGLDKLLEQQQITNILVVPIDYSAFQANQTDAVQQTLGEESLWEHFIHGLHNGILDFGGIGSTNDLDSITTMFNQKLVGNQADRDQTAVAIKYFINNRAQQQSEPLPTSPKDQKLVDLLKNLSPEAQSEFLKSTFCALEQHQQVAPELLQKIPAHLLKNTIAGKDRQDLNLSSRLFGIISNFANPSVTSQQRTGKVKTAEISEDMIRARLEVLFSEERPERFMPSEYQSALHNLTGNEVTSTIPADEKEKLKKQIETQPIENNYTAIIIELLETKIDPELEESIQQNLLDLSRFFLDIGDFANLRDIYVNWSHYLDSDKATISIFAEKVLANHKQLSFLTEVLDATELWEEEKQADIATYICAIGEPYGDLVIERLGLAPTWDEREYWMQILTRIGYDAKQMIVEYLDDDRWYLVRNLLIILGKKIDQHSMRAVQQLTRHEHPKVRMEAINCLFYCNPATANRQLLSELTSDDPETLLAAVQIADRSHNLEILEILHKNLNVEPTNAIELEIKRQIVMTLTRIGNHTSLPILRRILQKQGLLTSKRRKQLQQEIIQNLALFPDPAATKLLQELTTGKLKRLAHNALELRLKNSQEQK